MNRKAILIALGQTESLTPARAEYVRRYPEDMVLRYLLAEHVPIPVLEAADLPVLDHAPQARSLLTPKAAQTAVDTHLALAGFDMVPIDYVHPHIAERWDLDAEWVALFHDYRLRWAHGTLPLRVARVLELGARMPFRPLVPLIGAGIHPYGLDASRERFLCVDTHADHNAGFREWDAENVSTVSDI